MVFGERWTSRGAGDTNSLPRLDVAVQGATTEVVFLPYARLAIATSCVGTITRTYDDLDRLRSDTTAQGVISYTYDAADRRATMTVAGQLQVTYGYDDANRLTSVTQGTATVTITHDNADRRSPGEVARRCRGNPVGCSFAGVFNVKCNCQCDASSKR